MSYFLTQGGIIMLLQIRAPGGPRNSSQTVTVIRVRKLLVPNTFPPFKSYTGSNTNAILTARLSVFCHTNFYGHHCATFCIPHDNQYGHYTCNPSSGMKECLQGYSNPNTSCLQCGVAPGCCKLIIINATRLIFRQTVRQRQTERQMD